MAGLFYLCSSDCFACDRDFVMLNAFGLLSRRHWPNQLRVFDDLSFPIKVSGFIGEQCPVLALSEATDANNGLNWRGRSQEGIRRDS